MFFILSKTLYYLILPITILFILLVVALFIKRKPLQKKILFTTVILFFIFSNNFLGNTLLKAWEIDPIPYEQLSKNYEYGIVLTGVLNNEQEPYDRPHFEKGADRVFHTYQLYKKGIINKILISGGTGRLVDVNYTEAENIKQIFLSMEIPESDLITEPDSRNTAESAINVAQMLENQQDLLLITSAFHMRRSRDCFKKQDLHVDVFPVDLYTDPNITFDEYFLPSLNGLYKWTRLIQEVTGYVAYDIVGYI